MSSSDENRWAELWPEPPAKLPAGLLKHRWTQPTRWLHFGSSALTQLPWQAAELKRSQRSEVRPLILKATRGKCYFRTVTSPKLIRRHSNCNVQNPWQKQLSVLMLLKQKLIQFNEFTAAERFYFTSSQKLARELQHFPTQKRPHRHLWSFSAPSCSVSELQPARPGQSYLTDALLSSTLILWNKSGFQVNYFLWINACFMLNYVVKGGAFKLFCIIALNNKNLQSVNVSRWMRCKEIKVLLKLICLWEFIRVMPGAAE